MTLRGASSIEDEVTFLKRLAVSGRGAPVPMARLLAIFGLIYGLSALTQYAMIKLFLAGLMEGRDMYPVLSWMYGGGSVLFFLCAAAFCVSALVRRGKPALNTWAGAGWTAAGLALVTTILCAVLMFPRTRDPFLIMALPSILAVLYGAAWWVAGAVTGRVWLRFVAAGSFLSALAWAVTLRHYDGFLVAGVSLILLAFIPGVILSRRAVTS